MDDLSANGGQRKRDDDAAVAKRLALTLALIAVVAVLVWWLWPRFAPIPSIIGMTEDDARAAIERAGFSAGSVATRTIDTTEAGRIVGQLPPGGMRMSIGSAIDYTIAEPSGVAVSQAAVAPPVVDGSTPASGVIVPGVVGRAVADATSRIQVYGLAVRVAFTASGEAEGEVIHQFPSAGVAVATGSIVDLTVSTGAEGRGSAAAYFSGTNVPEVVGLGLSAARSKLANAGYGVRIVYAPSTTTDGGLVFWQSSGAGPEKARPGTIEIWVSTGEPRQGAPYAKPSDIAPFRTSAR